MTQTSARPGDDSSLGTAGSSPIPGLQWLGHGYDIFRGGYLNSKSVGSEPLFDWGKANLVTFNGHTYSVPDAVLCRPLSDFDSEFYSATTNREYCEKLGIKMNLGGEYDCFSGSLEFEWRSELEKTHDVKVVTLIEKNRYWQLLAPQPEKLRGMLLAAPRQHINEMPPNALYDRYGTHYLWTIQIGGSLIRDSLTTTTTFKSDLELKAAAEASLKVAKGSGSAELRQKAKAFDEVSHVKTRLEGGKTELGYTVRDAGFEKWANSIPENPGFAGFTAESFRPIWELAESKARRDFLKEAYDYYAARLHDFRSDAARRLLCDIRAFSTEQKMTRYTAGSRQPGWSSGSDVLFRAFAKPAPDTVPVYQQTVKDGTQYRLSVDREGGESPEFYVFREQLPGTVAIYERQVGGSYVYFDAKTDALRFGSQAGASVVFYAIPKVK